MSKPKMILAAVGGTVVLVSLLLGVLIWNAASGWSEKVDDLDSTVSTAEGLMRKPVYPGPKSVKALEVNRDAYAAWSAEARELAAQGDRSFEPTTAPAFKAFLVEDAHRLSELPGGVEGKLVKPDFAFGFSSFITGDEMPKDADLARFQREWYDISTVVKALAVTGVVEIVDVTRQTAKAAVPEDQDSNASRKAKKRRTAKNEKADAAKAPLVSVFTVTFRAKPLGLVNAVNAIVSSKRFIVVDEMSFVRESDELSDLLSGDAKKEGTSSRRSGRRGRRGKTEESFAEDAAGEKAGLVPGGVVTDPVKASLLKVSMTFSVYDFRTRQNGDQAENTEKGDGK